MLGCSCQTLFAARAGWLVGFIALLWCAATETWGQAPFVEDRPAPYVSLEPPTRKDIERRDSLKHYVVGLMLERQDQLLEAIKAYEEAGRLDPDAPAVFKAQIPILLMLSREKEALAAIARVLDVDPGDYEIWFVAGRLHKTLGHPQEARAAFQHGLEAPGLVDHPDVAQQIYLDMAGICEMMDDVPHALEALTQAVKILDRPDMLMEYGPFDRDLIMAKAGDTHERIGNLLAKQKKYGEAVAAYKKAQAASPERGARLNFNLAQLLEEQGRSADALVYLDQYLRFQPMGLEAYEMKAALYGKLKKDDAVVPWLEDAARADPNNVGLKVFLAKQYVRRRQYSQAEILYRGLADESPGPAVYQGLFSLYKEQPGGMFQGLLLLDKAIEAATKTQGPPGLAARQAAAMIRAVRDDGALAKELVRAAFREANRNPNLQFDTLRLLAALADKHQRYEEAEKFYRQSLPDAAPAAEAVAYAGLLRVLWKERKYEDVLQVCRDGLKKAQATNQVLFHEEMARAQARLGKVDAALQTIERALHFAGDNDKLGVRHLRVRVLIQGERFDQAEAECQALLKDHNSPGDVIETRSLLSSLYSARHQLAKAEEQLEIILKADPLNVTVNNDLGYLWADQSKNLDKAEELIRLAIELDREQRKPRALASTDPEQANAAYVDSLGWVLFRRGRLEEARRELELAVTLPEGIEDATVWDHLGDVYCRLRQLEKARTAWEKSAHLFELENPRKMDERHHELRRKLKALDTMQK